MYPVLEIMHMLNFLDTFSMGITLNLVEPFSWTLGKVDADRVARL